MNKSVDEVFDILNIYSTMQLLDMNQDTIIMRYI